jgi:molybdopterin converting factor subunit 1
MSEPGAGVHVLFFAAARDVVGERECWVVLGPGEDTVADLARRLVERYPALGAHLRAVRFAVNGEYVRDGDPVRDGDEAAVIPPVAGG